MADAMTGTLSVIEVLKHLTDSGWQNFLEDYQKETRISN